MGIDKTWKNKWEGGVVLVRQEGDVIDLCVKIYDGLEDVPMGNINEIGCNRCHP
jgi:hypothetical protein